uniref:Ion transport domain-containing protein n=1 Tax=Panagrolaimus davidi TaxID=227884 RepID=A0A914QTU5_9BILA
MTIFLMNLLIGLAVSDTTATLEKALRLRIKLQIETIHHIEIDMPETLRRHFWRGFRITKKTIGDDYEEDNPIGSFRQLFRWFGLSKDALKKEIPLNTNISYDKK